MKYDKCDSPMHHKAKRQTFAKKKSSKYKKEKEIYESITEDISG